MLILPWQASISKTLTLEYIEQVALDTAPEISEIKHKEKSLLDDAVAANQLADPKLHAGIVNLPTDTFSFRQENMTQILVGVSQQFPKGRSLSVSSMRQKMLAQAEGFRHLNTKAEILQIVRNEWLELYYWIHAANIVEENKRIFAHLVKVTESMLSAGKNNQHDVLRAQLEFSKAENMLIHIAEEIDTTRAKLAKWVGYEIAQEVYPNNLPNWEIPNKEKLQANLNNHPHLKTDDSIIAASQQNVKLAKQQYKPGFIANLNYGFRQGNNPMTGGKRSDFVGLQLSIDLPIFPKNRQDKKLDSSVAELGAAKDAKLADYRTMESNLASYLTMWDKLSEQKIFYAKHLLPEAEQYAKSTLTAYQNNQSDFPAVARAYITELDTKLEELKVRVDRNKIRAALLYLEGESK